MRKLRYLDLSGAGFTGMIPYQLGNLSDLDILSLDVTYLHRMATPHLASKSSSPLWYAVRRTPAHIIVLSSYSPDVKYTHQWRWVRGELKRVEREKTSWLIVIMHVPIYNSNVKHYTEGESMRTVFENWFVKAKVDFIFAGHVHAYERSYRISNIHYNISRGDRYPAPDKSAPVYVTVVYEDFDGDPVGCDYDNNICLYLLSNMH
ncbi:bifunctional purple acid phosphatase 26-like [Pistacia vera]|uniref:bifunctional purple acid phosphatase 26-like n=1 Tax=Pistacia vera TaxID=55513 RepID=UPI0012634513|nr:bifunctional purple acid phosphatase 26-like [Pistacia vera]